MTLSVFNYGVLSLKMQIEKWYFHKRKQEFKIFSIRLKFTYRIFIFKKFSEILRYKKNV